MNSFRSLLASFFFLSCAQNNAMELIAHALVTSADAKEKEETCELAEMAQDQKNRNLVQAARENDCEGVIVWLEHGADVTAIDGFHCAALRRVVTEHNPKIAQEILEHALRNNIALDTDAIDNFGQTALCLATIYGDFEMAKVLLAFGAKVLVANAFGETPFNRAVNLGHEKILKLFLYILCHEDKALVDSLFMREANGLLVKTVTDENLFFQQILSEQMLRAKSTDMFLLIKNLDRIDDQLSDQEKKEFAQVLQTRRKNKEQKLKSEAKS